MSFHPEYHGIRLDVMAVEKEKNGVLMWRCRSRTKNKPFMGGQIYVI